MSKVVDQGGALDDAYQELLFGFHFAERLVKDAFLVRIIRELIEMAFEAYRADDGRLGC
jgi:hypothetical protein